MLRFNSFKLGAQLFRPIMASTKDSIKYLNQSEAINLDQELFNEYAFSVDQLMELAGLSVASAVARSYPLNEGYDKPIICCGPGNNGGDGLVCARHLKLFGYKPKVVCPKPGRTELYRNLMTQCRKFDIDLIDKVPENIDAMKQLGNLILDSIFGFSFKPPNRNADFAKLLHLMNELSSTNIPLISIDIPSGWHVEDGPKNLDEDQLNLEEALRLPSLKPDCLISLTAPKLCAKHFQGRYHYLGGRFCPKSIRDNYQLNLPEYPGTECIVLLK